MSDCPAIPPGLTVDRLVQDQILPSGRRCFPVVEDSRALGLVTMHNVKAVPRDLWSRRTVGEAMTPFEKLKWVPPDEDLSSVMQLMTTEDVNQVPVVRNNQIVGMVARDKLLQFVNVRSDLGM